MDVDEHWLKNLASEEHNRTCNFKKGEVMLPGEKLSIFFLLQSISMAIQWGIFGPKIHGL
jgi:hypothetical protein